MSSKSDENYHYAILMETSGREFESWYNFIRYEGNEDNLRYLQKQLEKVDFYVIDDLSTFDLELEHLVSEETARQMCLVDLNAYMFHRKFNGKLQKINFGFSKRDDNEDRIEKVYDMIGNGDIDNYLDGEEDLRSSSGDTYRSTITIEQLRPDGTTARTYELYDAFPTDVSAIDLSYDTTDAVQEFTVTFQYHYLDVGGTSEAGTDATTPPGGTATV